MAIPDHHQANFQTLLHAALSGDLALLECADAASGEPRFVVCAVGRSGEAYLFTPSGHLHEGDPFAAYVPPAARAGRVPSIGQKGDAGITSKLAIPFHSHHRHGSVGGVKDGGAPPFCCAKSLPPPPLRGRVPRSVTPALTVHGFEGGAWRHPFANQGHRAPDSQSLFSLSRIPMVARDRVGLKDDGAPPFFRAGRALRLACYDGRRPKKS